MKVLIISGGEEPSEAIVRRYASCSDIIIGADKGCEVILKYNITPSFIVGDFDSASKKTILELEKRGVQKYQFKLEKDFSDTESAVNLAIKQGATEITMLGVTGTRYDHSIANLGLLIKTLRLGIKAEIVDNHNRIFLVDKKVTLYGDIGQNISFHSLYGPVYGLTIKGAKYEIYDYTLQLEDSRTISNVFVKSTIDISFKSGIVMVIYAKD